MGEKFRAVGTPVTPLQLTLDHLLNKQQYLYDIANKYGINLQGVRIVYDPEIPIGQYGLTRESEGGNIVHIGPYALGSEAEAANTIAHELRHARDYRRGAGKLAKDLHKEHGTPSSLPGDGSVYGAGNAIEAYIRGELWALW